MRLHVEHSTLLEYDGPVSESATEVRLEPTSDPDGQHTVSFNLSVSPQASISHYVDYYGNSVHHFTTVPNHTSLWIVATSTVDTIDDLHTLAPDGDDSKLYDFKVETRYVHFDSAVRDFAEQFHGLKDNARELGDAVCRRINETLIYETGVTDVHSTSAEVMALGRGVCQDFAQLMIATMRYLGVPTRYVSGYLYGGAASEDKDQASHAWCEVYGGPEAGWLGFDPTHQSLRADQRYIRIGVGRDYSDVPPVRGVYRGKATEKLKVAVRITAGQLAERGLLR